MLTFKETRAKKFYSSSLYHDFIFNHDRLAGHFFYDYRQYDDFKKRAEYLASGSAERQKYEIHDAIAGYNSECGCSPETLSNIGKLKEGALAVVGGQQPGLLGGPAFVAYKIITIIKLSIFLSGLLKTDVIPVFWNASDDSSTGQINSASILNGTEIRETKAAFPWNIRFSDVSMELEEVEGALKRFVESLPVTGYHPAILKFLNGVFRVFKYTRHTGPNYLFSCLILKLFGGSGLVVIDPCIDELKKAALDFAEFDLENFSAINEKIIQESAILSEEGYHNQIDYFDGSLNFFITDEGERRKINSPDKNVFFYKDKRVSKQEILKMIHENPRTVSLNVVLRCVFQDSMLPNICTVCGPGEVSYFSQLKGVYNIFNKKSGVVYPRVSATIIEKSVEQTLKKLGLDPDDLENGRDFLKRKIFKSELLPDLEETMDNFGKDVFLKIKALKLSLKEKGINVDGAFGRIEENIGKEISRLSSKIINEHMQSEERAGRGFEKIFTNMLPEGTLQERKISILNYINKYGFELVDGLLNSPDFMPPYHKFIYIE
jgi:bacillithiol biosynthesis cysteine-adding enzyme BshC